MPHWNEKIQLADVWKNDDLGFTVQRDEIVKRVKASHWYQNRDSAGCDERGEAVDNLAEAENFDEFNNWWNELYDYFDADRVWIALF